MQQYNHISRVPLKQGGEGVRVASRGKSKLTCNSTIMKIVGVEVTQVMTTL